MPQDNFDHLPKMRTKATASEREAARVIVEQGGTLTEAAQAANVTQGTVSKWVRRYEWKHPRRRISTNDDLQKLDAARHGDTIDIAMLHQDVSVEALHQLRAAIAVADVRNPRNLKVLGDIVSKMMSMNVELVSQLEQRSVDAQSTTAIVDASDTLAKLREAAIPTPPPVPVPDPSTLTKPTAEDPETSPGLGSLLETVAEMEDEVTIIRPDAPMGIEVAPVVASGEGEGDDLLNP